MRKNIVSRLLKLFKRQPARQLSLAEALDKSLAAGYASVNWAEVM